MPTPLQLKGSPRVALVHDWLTGMRGGEKCLEVLCGMFPDAPLFTLLGYRDAVSPVIANREWQVSFLQRIPGIRKRYRNFLPLFPRAIESLDTRGFDLILSTSHAVAKGIRHEPEVPHISYVHTPMRYVWDLFDTYFPRDQMNPLTHGFIRAAARRLRRWDLRSSDRVDRFIANSAFVAERIKRHYHREAMVIHPPVETDRFPLSTDRDSSYLVVSALVPYKRVDLAVLACNVMGRQLTVIGSGPDEARIRALAGPTVHVESWAGTDRLIEAYRRAGALLFPGEEDFGIVPVEAMATGMPVLAYGVGGATETVVAGETGVFFQEQTVEALTAAMRQFETMHFDAQHIRGWAERFDTCVFESRMAEVIEREWMERSH